VSATTEYARVCKLQSLPVLELGAKPAAPLPLPCSACSAACSITSFRMCNARDRIDGPHRASLEMSLEPRCERKNAVSAVAACRCDSGTQT
jgi:hypothetical protein